MAEAFAVTAVPPQAVMKNPAAWLLWILDFLVWLLTIVGPVNWVKNFFAGPAAVQVDGAWRLAASEAGLATRALPDCGTVHEMMQKSYKKYGDRAACVTRTYLGEHKPEGAKFPLKKFGESQYITFTELGRVTSHFGMGLLKLGLQPAPAGVDLQTTSGAHTILIFEETCAWWSIAAFGAFSQSIAVATSYATLGLPSVAEAISETGAKAVVCNIKDAKKLAEVCEAKCPSLSVLIYTTNYSTETKAEVPEGSRLKLVSMQEVIEMGAAAGEVKFSPPTPEHMAVIMYTSGSTGKPKGVMIKHSSMVASIAAMSVKYLDFGLHEGEERYLAYLPAAHILELVAETTMFCLGATVGYACPKTITNKGACRQRPDGSINTKAGYPYPAGSIQEFRPTCIAAVPKIWDIMKKGVEEQVSHSSPVKQFLFQVAYSARYHAIKQGRDSPLFNALVFNKVKEALGGSLKVGVSGGGPLSADVQGFIRTAFAVPLLQGYGLTETTCAGCVQQFLDTRFGVVGPPIASVELKLRPCLDSKGEPEVLDRQKNPYLPTDKQHYGMPCKGRGEVLIRGPSVSTGYYKQPEKTAEVYDSDGWFHTGDVALFTPQGALMIVDRVKNLLKLKGGEYIAIESMEKEYANSVYVNGINGGIMCYGDGDMDRPVALVQVNTRELENWAKASGTAYSSVEELCKLPAAEKAVLDALLAAGKKGGLAANEMLAGVGLISGTGPAAGTPTVTSPWTSDNEGLTASNKLNRKPIQTAYAALLGPLRTKAGA